MRTYKGKWIGLWPKKKKEFRKHPKWYTKISRRIIYCYLHSTWKVYNEIKLYYWKMVDQNTKCNSLCSLSYWLKISKQYLFLKLYFTHLNFDTIYYLLHSSCSGVFSSRSFSARWHKYMDAELWALVSIHQIKFQNIREIQKIDR